MDGRCDGCRWWDADFADDDGWHVCGLSPLHEWNLAEYRHTKLFLLNPTIDRGPIATAPDFGCGRWEGVPRPEHG